MSKRAERKAREALFASVVEDAPAAGGHDEAIDEVTLASSGLSFGEAEGKRPLTMMKKFRFQLLAGWMAENLAPCRAADIGGGKGLLAYLLSQHGWDATVIDPVYQTLPEKFKDLNTGRQIKLGERESVPRLSVPFTEDLAPRFDMLVAMHAHGCNIALIDAAERYGKGFLILPCCIIDEPLRPEPGVHWLPCLAGYARAKGFTLRPLRLNFKGQNIGLYAPPQK
ncbi:MAG: hypothetical protein QM758_15105 [Armatimonas sp.]